MPERSQDIFPNARLINYLKLKLLPAEILAATSMENLADISDPQVLPNDQKDQ